jgi:hypothetical protein
MSWNSIVSGTMFDAPIVSATAVRPLVDHGNDGDVGLDRGEGVVRGFGLAGLREGVEQRGLAGVREPDDADLHLASPPRTVPSAAPAATSDG